MAGERWEVRGIRSEQLEFSNSPPSDEQPESKLANHNKFSSLLKYKYSAIKFEEKNGTNFSEVPDPDMPSS